MFLLQLYIVENSSKYQYCFHKVGSAFSFFLKLYSNLTICLFFFFFVSENIEVKYEFHLLMFIMYVYQNLRTSFCNNITSLHQSAVKIQNLKKSMEHKLRNHIITLETHMTLLRV